jgi:hypothetical protein
LRTDPEVYDDKKQKHLKRFHSKVVTKIELNQSSVSLMDILITNWLEHKGYFQYVTDYVIFMDGSPISWRSKGQKNVTLSTTEAEYVALSEATRELKFIHQILMIMGVEVVLPIRVNVDNIGAIFLAANRIASNRIKHVDTRYHFVRDLIESNLIKVFFVPSDKNVADIFTKNLDNAQFTELQKKLMVHPRHTQKEGY